MEFDLGIYSDQILTSNGFVSGFLLVLDGKISAIINYVDNNSLLEDPRVLHYRDKAILPGIIDTHVHVNEPGRTEWEGFETATKSAISGGITTLIDMPLNCDPVTVSVDDLKYKKENMTDKLYCQVGFHGGIIPSSLDNISSLSDQGVYAFKIFMIHSGIDEFPHISNSLLHSVMNKVKEVDSVLMIHAELYSNVDLNGDPKTYNTYLQSRPRKWENDAIRLIIDNVKETGCRTHIIHLSSSDSLKILKEAKENNLPVTVETCPHYLYFNSESIPDGQTQFKCAPPIREKSNQDLLWKGIKDGTVDFIASDHSPSPPKLKNLHEGNFMTAWGGISSLQLTLSIIWTEANKREISLEKVIELMSTNPARFLSLHSKGQLKVGMDADFIVFDKYKTFEVTEDLINHKHKLTPYMNETLQGIVEVSYIQGEVIYNKENSEYNLVEKPFI